MTGFDPYHKWLGIAPKDQPPNHYRLLGVDLFEVDPDVIANAAEQRMVHVRSFQLGPRSDLSQRILNEIAAAKVCLLDPVNKAEYDAGLRQKMEVAAAPVPDSIPLARTTSTRKSRQTWKPQQMILVAAGAVVCLLVVGLILLAGNSKMPTASQLPKPEVPQAKPEVTVKTANVEQKTSAKPSLPPVSRVEDDPHLVVAKMVFQFGGTVVVEGRGEPISKLEDLPQNPRILHIGIESPDAANFTDHELRSCTRLDTLKEITIVSPHITDDGFKQLASSLLGVNLKSPMITDAGLSHIKNLPNLLWIDLNYPHITDDGLKHLAGLTHIRHINLSGAGIGDQGLKHLHGLKTLRNIDLDRTKVTTEGVRQLQAAIPGLKVNGTPENERLAASASGHSAVEPSSPLASEETAAMSPPQRLEANFAARSKLKAENAVPQQAEQPKVPDAWESRSGDWVSLMPYPDRLVGWTIQRNIGGTTTDTYKDFVCELYDGRAVHSLQGADMTIRARIKIVSGISIALILRANGEQRYVAVIGPTDLDIAKIVVVDKSLKRTRLGEAPRTPPVKGQFYEVEFSAVGDLLTMSVDGKQAVQVRDSSLKSGSPGFLAFQGKGMFKDVEIQLLDKARNDVSAKEQNAEAGEREISKTKPVEVSQSELRRLRRDLQLLLTFEAKTLGTVWGSRCYKDLSGQGNHAVVQTMLPPTEGKVGTALTAGKEGMVTKPILARRAEYTITAWVYPTGETCKIVSHQSDSGSRFPYYQLDVEGGFLYVNSVNANKKGDPWLGGGTPKGSVLWNQWNFVALVFRDGGVSKGNAKVTINNRTFRLPAQMVDSGNQAHTARIGWGEGKVDEVAIFGRALSDEEVQMIYELGKAGKSLAF